MAGGWAGRRSAGTLTAILLILILTVVACGGDQEAPEAATVLISSPPSGPASPPISPRTVPLASPTQPPGPPVVPTPGGTTETFRSAGAEVGPVVWASEVDPSSKAPRQPVAAFPGGTAVIHAALPLPRLARGTSLVATWSYNGTPLAFPPSEVIAERDERNAWVEFNLAQSGSEPWPDGIYAVEVQVDGQPAQRAAVVVGDEP